MRDSAGVRVVENYEPAWGPGDAWRLSETPTVDIGAAEGDPNYELFGARSSVRLTDGTIVVANTGTQELRWYDASGTYLRTIGGKGGGPGEFEGLDRIARLSGDSIVAYDTESNRVSVFGPAGGLGRSAPLEGPRGFMEGAFGDGSLLITASVTGGLTEGLSRWITRAFRYSNTGQLLDSLGSYAGPEWFTEVRRSGSRIVGVSSTSRPFARRASFAVSEGALYAGTQDSYGIAVYSLEGTLVGGVRRDYASLTVTAADIEAYKDRELADVTDAEARPERLRELERLPYPETMPAYGTIKIDSEGNLWVAEYRRPGDDQPRWMVFDASHRMLGIVETPRDFTVQQIGTDFVLGRERDELGVEHLQLYELIKPQ
ncbi:MAG: hypothetical protein GTN78_05300 [Gemmatimonadales bacterium]|nr:hypothetical protein [Gemmatimonadales bacterium]NIN12712.1 hypothetical protein [Gemmatimonadales bacterium]NIQ99603.1 hypothetical protein [Gemmatimonadales bacterium]NIS64160.1 hypothetical protein [Gemmatimonadales bacterium]